MSDPTDETSAPDDAHQELANPTLTAEAPAPDAGTAASGRDWPRVLGKVVFFAIALFLFILAIQLMKEGAKAIAPSLEDSPLFCERDLDARGRLARRVHRAERLADRGGRAQPVRRGRPHRAPDVHDALGLAPGCVVRRAAGRVPVRDAEQGPQPRRVDRHGRARAVADGDRLRPRDAARVRDLEVRRARRDPSERVPGRPVADRLHLGARPRPAHEAARVDPAPARPGHDPDLVPLPGQASCHSSTASGTGANGSNG